MVFVRLGSVRVRRTHAVVCFQPPSLLIGMVWVSVMYFCVCPIHCKAHWRVGRRPGLCRLTSAQPLIGSTIREFFTLSAQWVSEVLYCLYWQSFYQIVLSGVQLCSVLDPLLLLQCTSELFSILENKLMGDADDSTLIVVVTSPGARVTVADSLNSDLGKVSERCDLWKMKLNAIRIKTMIVYRSRTMHPQSPPLTIGGTVLK